MAITINLWLEYGQFRKIKRLRAEGHSIFVLWNNEVRSLYRGLGLPSRIDGESDYVQKLAQLVDAGQEPIIYEWYDKWGQAFNDKGWVGLRQLE